MQTLNVFSSVPNQTEDDDIFNIIRQRQTEELVIAFCGPLGSGTSTVAKAFNNIITNYKYRSNYIKASDQIKNYISRIPGYENFSFKNTADKIDKYQDGGNALREKYGNDIIAQLLIKEIAIHREQEKDQNSDSITPESRRHITIIDNLKHPDEVKLLKAVYGNMFYLFGVLCPETIRRDRLNQKNVPRGHEILLMERDKSETVGFGQKLLDTLQMADVFIRNDELNVTRIEERINRYIKLILGDYFITPTTDEYAMYCAQSAALKSSCLSRQVGAAIISKEGELISTGCNEVPKYLGGHYSSNDKGSDSRCMNLFGGKCANQKYKDDILKTINDILSDAITDNDDLRKAIFNKISNESGIKNLLEFSRSVHAEMDAIINVARLGNASLKEATLYCTTFPCHNCARHIVASGITKVFYIEPYEKSLARALHNDSIDFDSKINEEASNKVAFIPFEGVAPRQYMNLFMAGERKINGEKINKNLSTSKPRTIQYLDNHVEYELKVIKHINNNIDK